MASISISWDLCSEEHLGKCCFKWGGFPSPHPIMQPLCWTHPSIYGDRVIMWRVLLGFCCILVQVPLRRYIFPSGSWRGLSSCAHVGMVITFKKGWQHVIGKEGLLGGHEEIHRCMSRSENPGYSSQHSPTVPLWTETSAYPIPLIL